MVHSGASAEGETPHVALTNLSVSHVRGERKWFFATAGGKLPEADRNGLVLSIFI